MSAAVTNDGLPAAAAPRASPAAVSAALVHALVFGAVVVLDVLDDVLDVVLDEVVELEVVVAFFFLSVAFELPELHAATSSIPTAPMARTRSA